MKPLGYIYFTVCILLVAIPLSLASTNYILAVIAVAVILIFLIVVGVVNDHFPDHLKK